MNEPDWKEATTAIVRWVMKMHVQTHDPQYKPIVEALFADADPVKLAETLVCVFATALEDLLVEHGVVAYFAEEAIPENEEGDEGESDNPNILH